MFALSAYGEYHSTLFALVIAALSTNFAVLYYYHYRHHSSPVINLALLKNRNLSLSIFIYYCIPGLFTGVNILAIFLFTTIFKIYCSRNRFFHVVVCTGCFYFNDNKWCTL
ncbi:hypothetical protein PROPEN_04859 [Proteus penneri ATCC 35198]|nr:hypothetical protein PROPEN_04859 [Proteus penneri ATCC 35198]